MRIFMIDKEISKLTEGVMQNVNQRYQREWKAVYHSELHDVDFTLFLDKMIFNTMALISLMIIPLSLRVFQSELYQLVNKKRHTIALNFLGFVMPANGLASMQMGKGFLQCPLIILIMAV